MKAENAGTSCTDAEHEAILARATAVLYETSAAPVHFELDLILVVALIGQLQLAFRHPENTGPTQAMLREFVRDLIERLGQQFGPEVYQFLMMGFDEKFDA